MFSKKTIIKSIEGCSQQIKALVQKFKEADAVVIGAGSGLSASAGLTYSGERFESEFSDFIAKYHFKDMYSAGFYPYPSREEYWAYWSRHIFCNRYDITPGKVYFDLLKLVDGKEYFVVTTNVDHQFQLAGFEKERLFYTQGDYGLWQCSVPCHHKTYDNEDTVRRMVAEQRNMCVPAELLPYCPECGAPMSMNLRCDDTFVEDVGWNAAQERYAVFLHTYENRRILFLELGVGGNTPGIIKYPFWQMTMRNKAAVYACVNLAEAVCPDEIRERSICIEMDIGKAIEAVGHTH